MSKRFRANIDAIAGYRVNSGDKGASFNTNETDHPAKSFAALRKLNPRYGSIEPLSDGLRALAAGVYGVKPKYHRR
jgi:hypothetical protein